MAMVAAGVKALLPSIIKLCGEEINLHRNFKEELIKLGKHFELIQALLHDAQRKEITNEAVKIWLKNLEMLAFDADNTIDDINYAVLRQELEGRKNFKGKVKSLYLKILSTRELALKVQSLNKNLNSIIQEATDFGLQAQFFAEVTNLGIKFDSVSEWETDSFTLADVVGRESYVSRIVEMLTSFQPNQPVFSVLPIVGMGGLGKTTVVKLLYRDEKIKGIFKKLIWVYVSENFNAKIIFKKMLQALTGKEIENKEILFNKLHQHLKGKRLLLVLDDLWSEDANQWKDFITDLSCINSLEGSAIIVTTRSEATASIVGTASIPKLSKLPEEDCWTILKGRAFRKNGVIPTEFEMIGKKIAQKCQGLPLAAKVFGGLLCGKPKHQWCDLMEEIVLGEDFSIINRTLKLSYDHLPSQACQKCFAFCSIFPKGWNIRREMIVFLWISEGLVDDRLGNNYFNVLLDRNLLQPLRNDFDGHVTYCSMHDLVHDMASLILHESGQLRAIFMTPSTSIPIENAVNLRSIVFQGKVLDNSFLDSKHLRSLVVMDDENKELPKIDHLLHLRYLDVAYSGIECLPESIGKLLHLQVLLANNTLNKLPKNLENLINLRHLYIGNYRRSNMHTGSKIEVIPRLGHLPNLKSIVFQALPNVKAVGSSSDNNKSGEDSKVIFPSLEKLELSDLSSMTGLLSTGESQIGHAVVSFPCLESLRIVSCRKLTSAPSGFQRLKKLVVSNLESSLLLEKVLVNLNSLTILSIRYVQGLYHIPENVFPNNQKLSQFYIGNCYDLRHLSVQFGASLRKIGIYDCSELEELPNNLHCLHSLEIFHIVNCHKLTSIPYNPRGDGHEWTQGLTSLHDLRIIECEGLTELPTRMLESCTSSLECVHLVGLTSVTNMAMVIFGLQKMLHLKTMALDFKFTAKTDFPVGIGSFLGLTRLMVSCGMENWDRVQDQVQHLTALRRLELSSIEMEVVPEWLGKLSSLEELTLLDCPNLTKLPSKPIMKRIRKLRVSNCPLLNLEMHDDNSEWHKISHIADLHDFISPLDFL